MGRPRGEGDERTQQTQPKGKDAEGKPAKPETIPVPKRGEFMRDLEKVAGKPHGPSRAGEG
jgi:hypothetical protein